MSLYQCSVAQSGEAKLAFTSSRQRTPRRPPDDTARIDRAGSRPVCEAAQLFLRAVRRASQLPAASAVLPGAVTGFISSAVAPVQLGSEQDMLLGSRSHRLLPSGGDPSRPLREC